MTNTPGKKPIEWPAWTKSNWFLGLLTLILWLVSAAFSFYALLETQQTILRHLTDGETVSRWGFHIVRQWSSIFLVGIWLAFTIITGEFHYQHQSKPVSWQVFKWSYLAWGVIVVMALIL